MKIIDRSLIFFLGMTSFFKFPNIKWQDHTSSILSIGIVMRPLPIQNLYQYQISLIWKTISLLFKETNCSPVKGYFSSILTGAQPEIFQGRGVFAKLGHFDKQFVINSRKKWLALGKFQIFLLDTPETTFGMVNLYMDTIRAFFSKIRGRFLIFKKGQGRLPPSNRSSAPAL